MGHLQLIYEQETNRFPSKKNLIFVQIQRKLTWKKKLNKSPNIKFYKKSFSGYRFVARAHRQMGHTQIRCKKKSAVSFINLLRTRWDKTWNRKCTPHSYTLHRSANLNCPCITQSIKWLATGDQTQAHVVSLWNKKILHEEGNNVET
jgi:hypothetical protein